MAQTKRKSTKTTSGSRGKRTGKAPAAPAPDSYLPRPAWGVIYGVFGVLALLTLLQQDGVVLRMLRTMLGSLIGYGCRFHCSASPRC